MECGFCVSHNFIAKLRMYEKDKNENINLNTSKTNINIISRYLYLNESKHEL